MSLLANSQLIAQLRDYERAFGETTGLPLTLRPVEDFHLAHHGKRHENPFCALMAQWNKTCAVCLDAQQKTSDPSAQETRTVMCFAGLCESAVPLRANGENLLGFLQTGEVMLRKPTRTQFSKIGRLLTE
jgi:AraC-like DNA-binding protein/ligand-binding sensor protein